MDDSLAIWYRGARYELGQGPGGYAIWEIGDPRSQPLEHWPANPVGWSAAWSRFTAVEVPGTIVHLSPQAAGVVASGPAGFAGGVVPAGSGVAATPSGGGMSSGTYGAGTEATTAAMGTFGVGDAADTGDAPATGVALSAGPRSSRTVVRRARAMLSFALIAAGVACGVIGLFPGYYAGTSLAAQAFELVPHLIYLGAWALAGWLILSGGSRRWAGSLIGLGTSVVTFGLFVADVGTAVSSGTAGASGTIGAGLLLGLIGWLACTVGAAMGLRRGDAGAPRRPGGQESGSIPAAIIATLVALGAAVTFAPSWDHYTLSAVNGQSQSVTAGNAFSNPGLVIAGDVAVMVALVAVALVASLWRPLRLGAALLTGAAIPMVAQAISAIVQIAEPVSPAQFGISPSQAAQSGITISANLTPVFWFYCAFIAALVATAGWMLIPAAAPRARSAYPYPYPYPYQAITPTTTPSPGAGSASAPWFGGAEDSPDWTSGASTGPEETSTGAGSDGPAPPPAT